MDWQNSIDREPMKKISALAARLATEKVREEAAALDAGLSCDSNIKSQSDLGHVHARYRVRNIQLIGKGILIGAVKPIMGNIESISAYLEEHERNQALMLRKKIQSSFSPTNAKHYEHLDDAEEKTSFTPMPATWRVDDSREILLLMEIGDIEIIPSQVVRWMYETNEGEKLLPDSLKAYIDRKNDSEQETLSSTAGEENLQGSADQSKSMKTRQPVTLKKAGEHCGVSEATIRNWEGKRGKCPEGYPGRQDAAPLIIWGEGYKRKRAFESDAKKMNRAKPVDPTTLDSGNYSSAFDEDE